MRGIEDGGRAGANGLSVDPAAWGEWAVTAMPNSPGSDLPHVQKYTVGVDAAYDEVTGLTWQRRVHPGYTDPETAKSYCEGLELDGNRGFRVPRLIELVTLIDYLKDGRSIDGSVFDVFDNWVVSSATKTLQASSSPTFMVDFIAGVPVDEETRPGTLCVSGGPSGKLPEHYSVAQDIVVDNWTGLTWAPGPSDAGYQYADAVARCAELGLDGATWRLPSLTELLSVWDFTVWYPELDGTVFHFDKLGGGFWVAPTPHMATAGRHVFVMLGGVTEAVDPAQTKNLLCVH